MEKTIGFVLKSFKYGDTSAILHLYTQDFGMKSFLIKGFFSPKKKQIRTLQFPFVQVELAFKPNKNSELTHLYHVQPLKAYTGMHQHPVKLLMLQFLSEVLHLALREDEPNLKIYQFIAFQLNVFDAKKQNFADFHLIFLMRLTQFLGFFPNTENAHLPYFDLQEGNFSAQRHSPFRLDIAHTQLWIKLIHTEFDVAYQNQFNTQSRQNLLNALLDYYTLHIPGFREPKSLKIVKEVLG